MKVKDLIFQLRQSNPNDQVVIGLTPEGGYIGQKPCVGIVHLYNGFDWESGFTYIVGNQDLVTRVKYPRKLSRKEKL